MGKLQSKYAGGRDTSNGECFLVNAKIRCRTAGEASSASDVSFSIEDDEALLSEEDKLPLKVRLPSPCLPKNCDAAAVMNIDTSTDNNESTHSPSTPTKPQGFECDVSVEGSEKQEWSFTLYDFDGPGKTTKEDLARLLKSLYDSVGSSIKLPVKGTKNLKLRLTIMPDTSKAEKKLANSTEQTQQKPGECRTCKVCLGECKTCKVEGRTQKKGLPRLSTHERQQLADLVQRNMDRHHRKQQQNSRCERHTQDVQANAPRLSTSGHCRLQQETPLLSNNPPTPPPLPTHPPPSASPHHHRRHRHRERNRRQAMQNVAEWLEREHASPSPNRVLLHQHVHEHHHHHHYHCQHT